MVKKNSKETVCNSIIKTKDIDVAIQALNTRNCTSLDGSYAGWGDAELFRIIQCITNGCGIKLVSLNLAGNNFSKDAIKVLCAIIGPNAGPAIAAAAASSKTVNPQN